MQGNREGFIGLVPEAQVAHYDRTPTAEAAARRIRGRLRRAGESSELHLESELDHPSTQNAERPLPCAAKRVVHQPDGVRVEDVEDVQLPLETNR
jgi:hypothetical protein